MLRNVSAVLCLALCLLGSVAGQEPDPRFGMEFEFAGQGNRIVRFEEMPFENYERLLRVVVEHFGGDPSTIRRVDFTKPTTLPQYPDGQRPLFKAEWTDPRGRTWIVEPEYVVSRGLDGYELVTPVLEDAKELERILEKVHSSGVVREGLKSGVHLTIDGAKLVGAGGDARALANLIVLHENAEPLLRRIFDPVREGGHANRFARMLAVDHPDLVRAIDALPAEARTVDGLAELFARYEAREAEIQGSKIGETSQSKMWKYRSMNLAKVLPINPQHDASQRVVEFRMFDLGTPETHRLQVRLYRALVRHAQELAARGEQVRLERRAPVPLGEDPAVYSTPQDPEQAKREARQLIERLGLDPREFEPLLERTIRPRRLYTRSEFAGVVDALETRGEPKSFSYRFEISGQGPGVVELLLPVEAEVAARWGSLTKAERRAYYERVVGDAPGRVAEHFVPDTARFPWLGFGLRVDGKGAWHIMSAELSSVAEVEARVAEAKELAGRSVQGLLLNVRDTSPQWEQITGKRNLMQAFFERAARWVFVKRLASLRPGRALETVERAGSEVVLKDYDPQTSRQLEVEIKDVARSAKDVATLARIVTHQLRAHAWGEFPGVELAKRGAPRLLDAYARHLIEVEGVELTPERRRIVEGLARGQLGGAGEAITAPLLPWAEETGLPETTRRMLRYAREDYLSWLHRQVLAIEGGAYGIDPALASETALRELGLSSAEAAAVKAASDGRALTRPELLRLLAAHELLGAPDRAKLRAAGPQALDPERAAQAGISEAGLESLRKLRAADLSLNQTLALRATGLTRASVERIHTVLELLSATPLNQARLQRAITSRVQTWFAESKLPEGLLRSLIPRPTAGEGATSPTGTKPSQPPRRGATTGVEAETEAPGTEREAQPPADRLAAWRKSNGRVDWKRFASEKATVEAKGLAHFGLALFLKELAVAVKSGDRLYVEEFFDALLTTDFYAEYGLFVLGARAGEIAYGKLLEHRIKKSFVNSVLKTNLVLATGLALPAIVHGRLEGKAFAISLGSLGLSSTLVHGGTRAIKWVVDLRKARVAGGAARTGLALQRLTRAGAWLYSAAELAVILYVAEDMETWVNAYLDRKAAKRAIGEAGAAFLDAAREANATPESLQAAAEAYDTAWTRYRDFLYAPLFAAEAQVAHRMEALAETAKELDDKRREVLARIERFPRLRQSIRTHHGSLEAYAQHLVAEDEATLQADLDRILGSYERQRREQLREVYDANRRSGSYLTAAVTAELIRGATRTGSLVWRSQLRERASQNRLQTYADELQVFALAQQLVRDEAQRAALEDYAERVRATHAADEQLAHGDSGVVDASAAKVGITDRLEGR